MEEAPPKNRRWSPEEESYLQTAFLEGTDIPTLAQRHGRSEGAITSRLQQLDLLTYGPYTGLITGTFPQESEAAEPPANNGLPWTEDLTARLLVTHHTEGTPEALVTLAAEIGRSPRSLALKLVHLGVVKEEINRNPNPKPKVAKPRAAPKPRQLTSPNPSGKTVKISVTPEFQTAWSCINNGENLLILGSAGTGKSTFLKWLRKQLEGKKKYAVVAPTGMAALNVGGQTIHSFFGLKPQLVSKTSDWHKPRYPELFAKLDVLIIDEISMVRADIFTAIDHFLHKYGKNPGKPFGGCQLVLMGDLFQLPPVVRRDEMEIFSTLFPTPFFFSSPAWEKGRFGIVEFTQIFRQSDEPFINLLNRVRHGEREWGLLDALNRRVTRTLPPDAVRLAARNRTVDAINQAELAKLHGRARTYTARTSGNIDENAFTTPTELTLKVGARVMFTRNDAVDQRWVNGTLGQVVECYDEAVTVRTTDGQTHYVEPVKWEATRYLPDDTGNPVSTVAGTFTQLPLTLAWALTIHKVQGQTLENCVLDLSDGGIFAEGQLYVALSRARSLESLHLTTPVQQNDIRTHPAVQQFYAQLKEG